MSQTPHVSVVIPCRDASAWLAETLESVSRQAGPATEVIVIDDGSTDDSAGIARRAGAQVVSVPPQGVSAARNHGTRLARGQFVQYLDADDMLVAGTLAARIEALESRGADVALTAWTKWERQADGRFEAGETLRRRLGPRPDVDLLTDAWWPPGAVLYRRAIIDRIGPWRSDLPIIQDARFLLDAALCGASFVHVDAVGLRYRIHGNESLSRRDPKAFILDCFRSAADLHDRWMQDGSLDADRRQGLIRVLGHLARSLFAIDRGRFEDALDRLYRLDPRYLPESPGSLRTLSRTVGYRRAEHVALLWRRAKRLAGRP